MNTQHNLGTTQGGEDVGFPADSAHVPSRDGKDAYRERVDEYEQEGILRADRDAAFLAVILAELFRIACGLEAELQAALDHAPSNLDNLRAEHKVVQYLRAVRRIDRYVRLEIRHTNTGARRVIPCDRMAQGKGKTIHS
jgi:hypothetical protein